MGRMRLKYVVSDKDRHGNTRYYFRMRGQRKIRLPEWPGSARFAQAYEGAIAIVGSAPRPAPPPSSHARRRKEGGFIYFMRVDETVKIGYSATPVQRFGTIKTALSRQISALVCVPGTVEDERDLHALFVRSKLQGEWFKMGPSIERVMTRAVLFDDWRENKNLDAQGPTQSRVGTHGRKLNKISLSLD